eukprot:6211970-Pleurochrysis_carterae.AAC.6
MTEGSAAHELASQLLWPKAGRTRDAWERQATQRGGLKPQRRAVGMGSAAAELAAWNFSTRAGRNHELKHSARDTLAATTAGLRQLRDSAVQASSKAGAFMTAEVRRLEKLRGALRDSSRAGRG